MKKLFVDDLMVNISSSLIEWFELQDLLRDESFISHKP